MKQFQQQYSVSSAPQYRAVMVGCASSDFQATASSASSAISRPSSDFRAAARSGSTATSDYDYSVTASNDPSPVSAPPDTTAQDTINQVNQEMATQAANDAAEQQFLDGMAAAQQTEINAKNQAPSN